jgi:hypothetical protein
VKFIKPAKTTRGLCGLPLRPLRETLHLAFALSYMDRLFSSRKFYGI